MTDQFHNSGPGEQNVAQGDGSIGKQVNNYYGGISPEIFAEYAGKLAVTESALASFFKILEEQQVPLGDLDSKLREIAGQHKELLTRLETVQSQDQEVRRLKDEARQAIEAGKYAEAEELLNQAEARDVQAIEELEQAARQRRISAAASCEDNAMLQRIQFRHAKAAEYWQKATDLLPEDEKMYRGYYLLAAGYDLYRISRYKEALPLYEQSLSIRQEIGDKAGEGTTLNNISQIYKVRGDYATALKYLEQSLNISQNIGDKTQEGITLNNISQIYHDWGDYATALKHLKQSLRICRETGNRAVEGVTLNNIGEIHRVCGNYDTALPFYEQSLCISQEIGNKDKEWSVLNNIGLIYQAWGDYTSALRLYEQSLTISREIKNLAGEWTILNNIGQTYQAQVAYAAALTSYKHSLNICTEIGDRRGEALTRWNIGYIYEIQGYLRKAEFYISQAVKLEDEMKHPDLEEDRQYLKYIRAKLRGR